MTERQRAVAVVTLASVVQFVVAALVPLDPDETYYWDWSRHLAPGYLAHPPMIALLVKAGVIVFGATPFGVRVWSTLANLGAMLLLVALARRLGGERAAVRAACIACAMPILTTWLLLATPDPACFCFSMATLYSVDRAIAEPVARREALGWWILAGIALGLALASKYVAVLVPVGIVIACLTHRDLRGQFGRPGPWLASAIAGVVFAPVLVWNANHDWVSFRLQLEHGFGAAGRGGAADRVLEYIGSEAAMATPILFVLVGVVAWRTIRTRAAARPYLLAVTGVVTFAWFLFAAMRQPVEANWPLLAFPPLAIVASIQPWGRSATRWLQGGIGLGAAMVALIYAHTLVAFLPFPPDNDPVRRGHGWDPVADRVEHAAHTGLPGTTWIAGNRYQNASELAFHLPLHPRTLSLNIGSRPNDYDSWGTFPEQAAFCDNLVVLLDDVRENDLATVLAVHFTGVTMGARVAPGGVNPLMAPKRVWTLTCWRGTWVR